ncbi:MAG: cysteine desulfurase family protein [Gammaproteobacteria bacterium]|jgi:cysteine desulfurase
MAERSIYLDYAATSPVDPRVVEAMVACLSAEGCFANAASPHAAGQAARRVVAEARTRIGALVNAESDRLVFTSGATEANNLALKGVFGCRERSGHLITTRIEHRSVLETAGALEACGVSVTLIDCDADGMVAPDRIAAALKPETRLVSIMLVNNEIGTVQDVEAVAGICRDAGVLLHVDAAQGAGKVGLDIGGAQLDLCSLTAHKVNGPKGIGALYVRSGVGLEPLIHGGESALGIRAGTLPTHQIAGFGKAFELVAGSGEAERLEALREQLWAGLAAIPEVRRNGDPARSAPHILSVSFPGVEGESLRYALADIAVSQGSACTSNDPAPSHVLRSLGLSDALAESTLRFGVGRFTTEREIATAIGRVSEEVRRLRAVAQGAPQWCST